MKVNTIIVASLLVLSFVSYFGFGIINEYIDRESGAIVEQALADNTISQLEHLTEVQSLIKSGEILQANIKLAEYTETLVYILRENCALPKCGEALRNHEGK